MAEKEKDELEKMNEALSKSEQFVEKYQKPLLIGLGVVVAVIGAIIGVKYLYLEPREDEAQVKSYKAVQAFEADSIASDWVLNGDENTPGLLAVIEEYGSTDAGELNHVYAGVACYEKGEYEKAIEHFSEFKKKKEYLVTPAVKAKIGDCYVQLDKFEEAIPYFEEAAKIADNDVHSPIYLMKAATVCEHLKKQDQALKYYEEIETKYPSYYNYNGIERYVVRAKNK